MLREPNSSQVVKSPNIGYVRSEVTHMMPKWSIVEDCLEGQERIKSKAELYLPKPNAADVSADNAAHYKAYLTRAVYYNVTRKTLDGLVGQVFSRDPLVELPDLMENNMRDDIDGNGVSLDQQAKKGLAYTLGFGRFGLLVDYPVVTQPTSIADQESGFVKPVILQYSPKTIINWATKKIGARTVLSLVVLVENGISSDDGFELRSFKQWRVLQLNDAGFYVMTTWEFDPETENYTQTAMYEVKDSAGNPLTEIPFFFCGVLNNDSFIDEPPLYDLATLNIAHYRNSADYEDSAYMVGQPTPYFAGLTESWVNKVFKDRTIKLGARSAIPLPSGGVAGLLQANPNSMPFEAMQHKERQMMALGAKLVEPGGGSNTLGQAQLDESSESSMLSTAAKNVGLAYTKALTVAAKLYGQTDPEAVDYCLNTDFPASRLTPNERAQLVLEWQAGAITLSEMRAGLRKAGVATLDTEEYSAELITNPPPVPKAMTNNQGGGGSNNTPTPDKTQNNNGGNQAGT